PGRQQIPAPAEIVNAPAPTPPQPPRPSPRLLESGIPPGAAARPRGRSLQRRRQFLAAFPAERLTLQPRNAATVNQRLTYFAALEGQRAEPERRARAHVERMQLPYALILLCHERWLKFRRLETA